MTTMNITKVSKKAPAAAPRKDAQREGLIDTAEFLRRCAAQYGLKPVLAVQGTAHRDADVIDAKSGRHLVAAVNSRGHGFALLNSHFKDRRAHIGMCAVRPGTTDMLIIDSTPVQRWKGYAEVLESFEDLWPEARTVLDSLSLWSPGTRTLRTLSEKMVNEGYMSYTTLYPTAESLFDNYDGDALGYAYHLVAKMKAGRLPSRTPGTRRVRAIRRPDSLFHAGMVAFELVKERARELGRVSARCSFRVTEDRRIRT